MNEDRLNNSKGTASVFEDLLIAMLAVNNWSIDRTMATLPLLQAASLTDPSKLATLSHAEVCEALENCEYKRGDFIVALVSERLVAVAQAFVRDDLLRKIDILQQNGEISSIKTLLLSLQGIGPVVCDNFLRLRACRSSS